MTQGDDMAIFRRSRDPDRLGEVTSQARSSVG